VGEEVMLIETKFNIGDIVWVPRVYPKRHVDKIVVDGKTYYAEDDGLNSTFTYEPDVVQLIVNEIVLTLTDGQIHQVVWGKTAPGYKSYSENEQIFDTKSSLDIFYFSTEDEALACAKCLAEQELPYYG
jgi:hypothetical protein